jgi:hypothetical protein
MKKLRFTLICGACGLAMFIATPSFSGVEILLKNGKSMRADACQSTGTKLRCAKMGGTFELDKADVSGIRELGEEGKDNGEGEPSMPEEQDQGEKKDINNQPDGGAPGGETRNTQDDEAAAGERLSQITERKLQLKEQRKALVAEKQRYDDAVSAAPERMTVEQFGEMQKRSSDLDKKIDTFNTEVKGLDTEEKDLSAGIERENE